MLDVQIAAHGDLRRLCAILRLFSMCHCVVVVGEPLRTALLWDRSESDLVFRQVSTFYS